MELKWVSGNKVRCTDTAYLCYLSRGSFHKTMLQGKLPRVVAAVQGVGEER